jgi:hypothetical protein
MASTPSKTTTTKTVNNKTGITTAKSTTTSGGSTTVTKTTTIGKPATTSSSSSISSPASAAAAVLGERWITGPNSDRPLCAPVAVANSLLARTGLVASNGDIERLYREGGAGDAGLPVEMVLDAATRTGLAGCRVADWHRLTGAEDADLVLIDFAELDGLHAAAVHDGQVAAWGDEIPVGELNGNIIGAWSLTWHGEDR